MAIRRAHGAVATVRCMISQLCLPMTNNKRASVPHTGGNEGREEVRSRDADNPALHRKLFDVLVYHVEKVCHIVDELARVTDARHRLAPAIHRLAPKSLFGSVRAEKNPHKPLRCGRTSGS